MFPCCPLLWGLLFLVTLVFALASFVLLVVRIELYRAVVESGLMSGVVGVHGYGSLVIGRVVLGHVVLLQSRCL